MSLRMEAGFEHLKNAIAQALVREVEFLPGMLVTVLGAKMTANTAHAKIILSVFPVEMEGEALRILKESDRVIKESLAEQLRLRRIPDLHFSFDETEAEADKIEHTIHDLQTKGEIDIP